MHITVHRFAPRSALPSYGSAPPCSPPKALLPPCYALTPPHCSAHCSVCSFPCGSASSCPFFLQPCYHFAMFALPCSSLLPRRQLHASSSSLPSPYYLTPLSCGSALPPPLCHASMHSPLHSSAFPPLPCSFSLEVPTAPPQGEEPSGGGKLAVSRASPRSTASGKRDGPNPSPLPHSMVKGSGVSLHPFLYV